MSRFRCSRAPDGFVHGPLALARRALLGAALAMAGAMATAGPAVLAPSLLADGTPVDSSSLGKRMPVVLVHGLGGSTEGWDSFLRAYGQNPPWRAVFKPYSFRYSSTTEEVNADPSAPRSISGLGAALRDAMQGLYDRPMAAPDFGFGNKRVIVLAHSMGGLVARSMMQEHVFRDGQRGGQKVLHLITLGTPHQGTPLSDAAMSLGLDTVRELDEGYPGFVADTAWTNFDGLDMAGGRCNHWLAQLNNYAPAAGGTYGRCGPVPANPLPGYYWKIIAYGASALQERDWYTGGTGVFKPGSSTSLYFTYNFLRGALPRPYPNDGVVPLASAQFDGPSLWARQLAYHCDHRYIRRGYPEFVRSASASYTDWAFCAGTDSDQGYASGVAGGYAVSGSIFGVPGGVVDTIRSVSEMERVLDWFEATFPEYLSPAGATSDIVGEYYYRYYSATQAYMAVRDGSFYFLGRASQDRVIFQGTLADLLPRAQAAGF